MRKLLLLSLALLSLNAAFAQRVDKKVFDFGQVQNWDNPKATFNITNTSKEKLVFLPVFYSSDIQIALPEKSLMPGESGEIAVMYYTASVGTFNRKVTLYTGNSPDPIELTVKGDIKSFAKGAVLQCPTVGPKKIEEEVVAIPSMPDTVQAPMTTKPPTNKPVQTKPVVVDDSKMPINQYAPNNVVFLIDISKSMQAPDKLPLLKKSMKELVMALRSIDNITVLAFNRESKTVIPTTTADNKEYIMGLIDSLKTFGSTNGVKGLEHAYTTIEEHFIPDGNNQIIISTDGVFNNPNFDEGALQDMIQQKTEAGIILSVVGFGDDRSGIRLMRKLASNGKGNYLQFSQDADVNMVLVEEIRRQSLIE